MALTGSHFKVKQDPGLVRNVKSNVESDVDLSCSVVIFQPDFNLLLSGPSRTACAHKSATFLLQILWLRTTRSTNGKILFPLGHFLPAPVSPLNHPSASRARRRPCQTCTCNCNLLSARFGFSLIMAAKFMQANGSQNMAMGHNLRQTNPHKYKAHLFFDLIGSEMDAKIALVY